MFEIQSYSHTQRGAKANPNQLHPLPCKLLFAQSSLRVPGCPQYLMCTHVSGSFLLVLVLLFLLVFIFLLFLGVKVFTTNVEQLLHLQYIPRAYSRMVRMRKGRNEKVPKKSSLQEEEKLTKLIQIGMTEPGGTI